MVVQSVDKIINKAILRALEIKRQVFIVAPKIIETGTGKKYPLKLFSPRWQLNMAKIMLRFCMVK